MLGAESIFARDKGVEPPRPSPQCVGSEVKSGGLSGAEVDDVCEGKEKGRGRINISRR